MPTGDRILFFREDKSSLRVTSVSPRSVNFASAKRFCILESYVRPLTSLCSKISSFSNFPPHGPKPWTLRSFLLNLWIELRFCMCEAMTINYVRKIQPAKTTRFVHENIQLFHQNCIHSLRLNCHATCPRRQRILLSKRTSRLYESFGIIVVRIRNPRIQRWSFSARNEL